MTPEQAKQPDTYLEIDHPLGGKRYPAHIFDLDQGVAWIEYGWSGLGPLSAPSNPIHLVRGKVEATGDGQWQIQTEDGLVTIRTLRLAGGGSLNDEDTIMKLIDFPEGDRERARQRIEENLNIKLPLQK